MNVPGYGIPPNGMQGSMNGHHMRNSMNGHPMNGNLMNGSPMNGHLMNGHHMNSMNGNFRGVARVKQPSREVTESTKVEIKKPKVSILDKYKFKPKAQQTLDSMRPVHVVEDDIMPRKRRLVRGSVFTADKTASPSPGPQFTFKVAQRPDGALEDLDALEERIRSNRKRKARARKKDSEDEYSSDGASDAMSDEDDVGSGVTSIDSQILEFVNTCLIQDMIEICVLEPAVAELVIAQRPFASVHDVAANNFVEDAAPLRKKKTLGLRLVENAESRLKGYRAVDSLIRTCSEYGARIARQMERWGVSVTGTGELDVVDIGKKPEKENDEGLENLNNEDSLEYISQKPKMLADNVTLNNYQQVGINWLNMLYQNRLSCILADEMGLGKTCQVIAFMAHLKGSAPRKGPHLVVVPASTIENWLREFAKFCPEMVVQAYYGSVKEREQLRYELRDAEFDVLVTTYTLATSLLNDFKFLRNLNCDIIVYDEGHFLKNSGTERYTKLMRLQGRFRLLLTGTPLQNNLKELVSLLSFMLPELFHEKKDDLHGLFNQKVGTVTASTSSTPTTSSNTGTPSYNPLLSVQAISKAKTMMTPFVLRRKKDQVLQHLPAKSHEIVSCELTEAQRTLYDEQLSTAKKTRAERERRKLLTDKKEIEDARKNPIPSSLNVLMQLRKVSLHPLLFRVLYTDAQLKKMARAIMDEPEYVEANETFIFEDMQVMCDYELNALCEKFPHTLAKYQLDTQEFLKSGKIEQLTKLLDTIINKRKEKVLIFSLFTQMLDILERAFSLLNYKFVRLDGTTSVDTRQDIIDRFYEDDTIPIFLVSTKAGGFGINLVAANNVIIFDQSFNPHDDKQAEDRAHRVGQKKPVTVYKLIVKDTIEENILQLADNKLALDQSISAEDDLKAEEKAASDFEKFLF